MSRLAVGFLLVLFQAAGDRPDLVAKAEAYRARLMDLVPHHERSLRAASEKSERWAALFAEGLISRRDLEGARREREEAEARLEETRRQIRQSDDVIAETTLAEEVEKNLRAAQSETVIRFDGSAPWSLAKIARVESFFAEKFGYALPVSARGQTALHDRLGFEHHDAVDVALHPDSAEGRELMEYLRKAGFPFIAFRSAVQGSATGAHIHVGKASVKVAAAA